MIGSNQKCVAPMPCREPEVRLALNALENSVARLFEAVSEIAQRTEPVCRSANEECTGQAGRASTCAIGGAVFAEADRIERMTGVLRDLLDRLEV